MRDPRGMQKNNAPSGFDDFGCWVRVLRTPVTEISILAFREDLGWRELLGHENIGDTGYTSYSSCTYIRRGFGIALFNGGLDDNFGIFIRPFNRRIDWFYDGRHEIITDDIKPERGKKYNNGGVEGSQLWNCSLQEISDLINQLRNYYARDIYYRENPNEPVTLGWNEGFLRYKQEDITGLLINSNSKVSVFQALAFREALRFNARLFEYDSDTGECRQYSSASLCEKHGINQYSQEFQSSVLIYRKNFKINLEEIRQQREKSQSPALLNP